MSRTLHELRGLITANVGSFVRGIGHSIKVTQQLGTTWLTAGRSISASADRIGLAVGVVTGLSIRKFARFEETMVRVGAVTQTLGKEGFGTLETAAKRAGETTRFTATQSAEAMEKLGLAGLKTNEIIGALPGALQLASAAQIEIATASDIAAKTMRAYGLEASELTRINDTMVATFTKANTDLLQLSEGMKASGPVANGLNVSLETTTAILAKMADAGFQGSVGGMAFRNILSRLAGATPEVTNKLRELGIETTDAAGNMRPLFDILRDIERAGLSTGKIMELFGQRGGPQLVALLEVGVDEIERFKRELEASRGIARRMEQATLNTLGGQFDIFKSQVEGIVLALGGKMNPSLREAIGELQQFLKEHRTDIVERFAEVLAGLAEFARDGTQAFVEYGPEILETTGHFTKFLAEILKFLAEHPRLLAMMMLLKAGSVLGINRALIDLAHAVSATVIQIVIMTKALIAWVIQSGLAKAAAIDLRAAWIQMQRAQLAASRSLSALPGLLISTASQVAGVTRSVIAYVSRVGVARAVTLAWNVTLASIRDAVSVAIAKIVLMSKAVWGYVTSAGAARLASLALKTALVGLAIAGIVLVARKVYEANTNVREFNRLLKETSENANEISGRTQKAFDKVIAKSEELRGAQKQAFLREELKRAQANMEGLIGRIKGQREQVERLNTSWNNFTGNKVLELAKKNLEDDERLLKVHKENVERIRDAYREVGEASARALRNAPRDSGMRSSAPVGQAIGNSFTETVQAEAEDLGTAIGQSARDSINQALEQARLDSLETRSPGAGSIREFLGMEGLRPEDVQQFVGMQAGAPRGLAQSAAQDFAQMGPSPGQQQLDQLAMRIANTINAATQHAQNMSTAQPMLREFGQTLLNLKNEGTLAKDQIDQFATKAIHLKQALLQGRISADEFRDGMLGLTSATNEAVAAARREEEQKKREALMRGDFAGAGLDPQRALQERIAAFQLQRFNAGVEQGFQHWLRMNGFVQRTGDGLSRLNQQARNLGNRFQGMNRGGFGGGGGFRSPQQAAQQWDQFMGIMTSVSGQIGAAMNQIAFLQQRLQVADLSYQQQTAILQQIRDLNQQIVDLQNMPPPISLTSAEDLFKDPGLQTGEPDFEDGITKSRGGANVTVNIPTLRSPDAETAVMIKDIINTELQRQGAPGFFG